MAFTSHEKSRTILKQYIILSLLFLSNISCNTIREPIRKSLEVSIIDKHTDSIVVNAEVILTTIVEAVDIYTNTKYTDSSGRCSFEFEFDPLAVYRIMARKKGFYNYMSEDSINNIRPGMNVIMNTKENISLFLTSDSSHYKDYWNNKLIRYNPDTLIYLLRSNKFIGGIPLMIWEDIPALLTIAADTTIINHFPTNPISSYLMKQCRLGIVSLWFIESVRISEAKNLYNPASKYPSLNPVLSNTSGAKGSIDDIDQMNVAYNAYLSWWNGDKELNRRDRAKINPLERIDLEW